MRNKRFDKKTGTFVAIKRSKALVVDHGFSPEKKRYFPTYEAAHEFAERRVAEAKAAGEQSQDRFYLWHAGVCYSYGTDL
jgi:hypothetical protein